MPPPLRLYVSPFVHIESANPIDRLCWMDLWIIKNFDILNEHFGKIRTNKIIFRYILGRNIVNLIKKKR